MVWFISLVTQPFVIKAFIVGALISISASLLGVTLVVKRYSMIGDGLSHVAFGALSVAMALGTAPLVIGMPVVLLSSFFLLQLSERSTMSGDSAIAMVSGTALAIGVAVTALRRGMNMDVYNYMFGSVLAIPTSHVYLSAVLAAAVIGSYVMFYNIIFTVTFDETFAKAIGVKISLYKSLIAALVAVTIVIGMRIMGTMLISGLIVFPALSAMRVCGCFKHVSICAALISLVCFLLGMILSCSALEIPTGAAVIIMNALAFCICTIVGLRS